MDGSFVTGPNIARDVFSLPNLAVRSPAAPLPNLKRDDLEAAVECLNEEFDLCTHGGGESQDARIRNGFSNAEYCFRKGLTNLQQSTNQIGNVLKRMKWRFRIQEHFWLAVEGLANKDLVKLDEERLRAENIQWESLPEWMDTLIDLLSSFSYANECGSLYSPDGYTGFFHAPLTWLAHIIGYTSRDLPAVISYLATTGILGKLNRDHYASCEKLAERPLTLDPGHRPLIKYPQIGFRLPQDLSGRNTFGTDIRRRYNTLKITYEHHFGENTWGDSSMIDACIQSTNNSHSQLKSSR